MARSTLAILLFGVSFFMVTGTPVSSDDVTVRESYESSTMEGLLTNDKQTIKPREDRNTSYQGDENDEKILKQGKKEISTSIINSDNDDRSQNNYDDMTMKRYRRQRKLVTQGSYNDEDGNEERIYENSDQDLHGRYYGRYRDDFYQENNNYRNGNYRKHGRPSKRGYSSNVADGRHDESDRYTNLDDSYKENDDERHENYCRCGNSGNVASRHHRHAEYDRNTNRDDSYEDSYNETDGRGGHGGSGRGRGDRSYEDYSGENGGRGRGGSRYEDHSGDGGGMDRGGRSYEDLNGERGGRGRGGRSYEDHSGDGDGMDRGGRSYEDHGGEGAAVGGGGSGFLAGGGGVALKLGAAKVTAGGGFSPYGKTNGYAKQYDD